MGEIILVDGGQVQEPAHSDPAIGNDEKLIALFYRQKFQRTRSEHTLRAYQSDITRFREHLPKPLATITVSDLLEWADTLTDRAPGTRARFISSVRSLFRFALRTGYIRFNPAEILDRPKVPITSDTRFLTRVELQALLKEAQVPRRSRHLYPALVLMATTAVRISELVNIRWGDFFQDVHGHIGLKVVKAKGSKPRTVKVLPDVWRLLQERRRQQGAGADLDAEDTSPLFPGPTGEPITARNMQKSLTAAAKAAGIKKKVSPHWIRHTSITLALVGGARVEQAQAMAGHSDLRTTTRYAHTAQQLQDTASDYIRLEI